MVPDLPTRRSRVEVLLASDGKVDGPGLEAEEGCAAAIQGSPPALHPCNRVFKVEYSATVKWNGRDAAGSPRAAGVDRDKNNFRGAWRNDP
jgi:hypothetical protein